MRLKVILFVVCFLLLPVSNAGAALLFPQDANSRQQDSTNVIVVAQSNLNIRSLPSTNAPSLQVAPANTSLLAIGRNANTSWVQVEYSGVIGWVSVYYVNTSSRLSVLPVTDGTDTSVTDRPQERSSAPDGTLVNAGELVVFAAYSEVNVRALPSDTAPILGKLVPNERATVTLLDPSRSWGRISFQEQQGWVALYVVNVLGDIRTVPIVGAPTSGSDLPISDNGGGFSLEQREIVRKVQTHMGRYLGAAGTLMQIMSNGANSGIIACGPDVGFFRSYRLTRLESSKVPELVTVVDEMNTAFAELNRARAPWVAACEASNTLLFRDQFPTWLATAQGGATKLESAQRNLANLAAR